MQVENLIRHNVRTLEPYHSAREAVQEGILLDANENPFSRTWQGLPLNRYPDPGQGKLREELARYVGVDPAAVVAGTGSDEVLDWIFKVFCDPACDAVTIAAPTYGMYEVMAGIFGIAVDRFSLEKNFELSARRFLNSVSDRVKVLFLCSPNNPTGNSLQPAEILRICRQWGKIVVLDEAYIEFSEGESLVPEIARHPNLVVMRTLSKAFGMAGLRLGYAVCSPPVSHSFMKVKAPYNLGSLTQEMAVRVLQERERMERDVRRIRRARRELAGRLRCLAGVEEVFSSQANFLLFRCRHAPSVCRKLREKGVVVRDRSDLSGLEDCLRVSIGTRRENEVFLQTLSNALTREVA